MRLRRARDQIPDAATHGQNPDQDARNDKLEMVQIIELQDTLEAMLAVQMTAVHNATMTFARGLNHVGNIPRQDSAGNAFN